MNETLLCQHVSLKTQQFSFQRKLNISNDRNWRVKMGQDKYMFVRLVLASAESSRYLDIAAVKSYANFSPHSRNQDLTETSSIYDWLYTYLSE